MRFFSRFLILSGLAFGAYAPGEAAPPNLLPNPGFEDGEYAFTTDYQIMNLNSPAQFNDQITAPGQVAITDDPHLYGTAWSSAIRPHSGNTMLIVDGAYDSNLHSWISSPVIVQQNTDYDFSAYLTALYHDNLPLLRFTINGQQLGKDFSPSPIVGQWTQFHAVWNSGGSTAVVIALADEDTQGWGNDFALDDLYFGQRTWLVSAKARLSSFWQGISGSASEPDLWMAFLGAGAFVLGIGLVFVGIQLSKTRTKPET